MQKNSFIIQALRTMVLSSVALCSLSSVQASSAAPEDDAAITSAPTSSTFLSAYNADLQNKAVLFRGKTYATLKDFEDALANKPKDTGKFVQCVIEKLALPFPNRLQACGLFIKQSPTGYLEQLEKDLDQTLTILQTSTPTGSEVAVHSGINGVCAAPSQSQGVESTQCAALSQDTGNAPGLSMAIQGETSNPLVSPAPTSDGTPNVLRFSNATLPHVPADDTVLGMGFPSTKRTHEEASEALFIDSASLGAPHGSVKEDTSSTEQHDTSVATSTTSSDAKIDPTPEAVVKHTKAATDRRAHSQTVVEACLDLKVKNDAGLTKAEELATAFTTVPTTVEELAAGLPTLTTEALTTLLPVIQSAVKANLGAPDATRYVVKNPQTGDLTFFNDKTFDAFIFTHKHDGSNASEDGKGSIKSALYNRLKKYRAGGQEKVSTDAALAFLKERGITILHASEKTPLGGTVQKILDYINQ